MAFLQLLHQVALVGGEFRRRGMIEHLRSARVYWLAIERELVRSNGELEVHWSRGLVQDWMENFQLEGQTLLVLPAGAPCPKCGRSQATVSLARTLCVWDGGSRHQCGECGLTWLVLDGAKQIIR